MANEKRLIEANTKIIDKYFNKRLISLDKALKATNNEIYWTESQQAAVRSFLVQQPRVDAVEVVRCKDCKHFIQQEHGCNHFGYYSHTPWVDEVDFCSYGERKDNERKAD